LEFVVSKQSNFDEEFSEENEKGKVKNDDALELRSDFVFESFSINRLTAPTRSSWISACQQFNEQMHKITRNGQKTKLSKTWERDPQPSNANKANNRAQK
jgi:hypothetical protein